MNNFWRIFSYVMRGKILSPAFYLSSLKREKFWRDRMGINVHFFFGFIVI